jgi:hypothetical protein
MWKEGRGKNTILDREHRMYEGKAIGDSMVIWIKQLVQKSIGVEGMDSDIDTPGITGQFYHLELL